VDTCCVLLLFAGLLCDEGIADEASGGGDGIDECAGLRIADGTRSEDPGLGPMCAALTSAPFQNSNRLCIFSRYGRKSSKKFVSDEAHLNLDPSPKNQLMHYARTACCGRRSFSRRGGTNTQKVIARFSKIGELVGSFGMLELTARHGNRDQ